MVSLQEDFVWSESGTAWISGLFIRSAFCKPELGLSHSLCGVSVAEHGNAKISHPISCMLRLDKERSFCLQAAQQVNNIYKKIPRLQGFTKSDQSPVTAVDVAIQGTLLKELSLAFSDDPLVAEEDIAELITDTNFLYDVEHLVDFRFETLPLDSPRNRSSRWWTLDPIDGTKGLLSGGDFAIGLALQKSRNGIGYPVLGSLILPKQGVLLLADVPNSKFEIVPLDLIDRMIGPESANDGTFANSEEDIASIPKRLSLEDWHFSGGLDLSLEGHGPWKPLCCGSLVKYASVAQRKAFALIQTVSSGFANSWDHAAGIAAVRASGGTVSDEYGKDFAVGSEEDPHFLKLEQGSTAIVASARGISHTNLCAKVRYSLRYSYR